MLNAGKFANVKKLLFGARCEVRQITRPDSFWSSETKNPELGTQLNASERVGVVRSTPDHPGQFHVFYSTDLNQKQQTFLAKTLQSFMAVTYSAIGLDTSIAELVNFESAD